jgi:hypothetical protein
MRRPLTIWVACLGTVAAVYAELDKRYDGWTFSEHLRPWAQDHPVIFAAGCVAAPVWFHRHILKRVEGSLSH